MLLVGMAPHSLLQKFLQDLAAVNALFACWHGAHASAVMQALLHPHGDFNQWQGGDALSAVQGVFDQLAYGGVEALARLQQKGESTMSSSDKNMMPNKVCSCC
jgi:hypothetical protein